MLKESYFSPLNIQCCHIWIFMSNNNDSCKEKCALICNHWDSQQENSHKAYEGEFEKDVKVFAEAVRHPRLHCKTVKQAPTAARAGKVKSSYNAEMKGFLTSQSQSSFSPQCWKCVLLYLLRTAQHVSLGPSDALLQDPALLLKHTQSSTNTHTHTYKPQRKCKMLSRVQVHICLDMLEAYFPFDATSKANMHQKITCLFMSESKTKCRTSATMSPFSACTWAMAPRSRITLNTSYTCSTEEDAVMISDAQTQLFSSQDKSWILLFTACPWHSFPLISDTLCTSDF